MKNSFLQTYSSLKNISVENTTLTIKARKKEHEDRVDKKQYALALTCKLHS